MRLIGFGFGLFLLGCVMRVRRALVISCRGGVIMTLDGKVRRNKRFRYKFKNRCVQRTKYGDRCLNPVMSDNLGICFWHFKQKQK